MIIKASIVSILVNYDHLIGFITITDERDDILMMELGNQVKFGKELILSLMTLRIKAFDGNYEVFPMLRELSSINDTKSTISDPSFRAEACGC